MPKLNSDFSDWRTSFTFQTELRRDTEAKRKLPQEIPASKHEVAVEKFRHDAAMVQYCGDRRLCLPTLLQKADRGSVTGDWTAMEGGVTAIRGSTICTQIWVTWYFC